MNLRNRVRALAMTSMLALSFVSVPAGQVLARPKPVDDGIRCAYHQDNGEWNFYTPGDVIFVNGNILICGTDGHWKILGMTLPPDPGPKAPQPTGDAPTTETTLPGPPAPLPAGNASTP